MGRGRRHRPTTLHTRRPGRCTTSGRSLWLNFMANRRRTRPGRVGEAAAATTVDHRSFLIFSGISGHFWPTHTSLPPFLDPLNSFPWSLFANSSSFESYDKNKVGRLLDRVFRPPQQLLDQGNGTDEFLVSWDFHLYMVCEFWTSFGWFSIFGSFRVITEKFGLKSSINWSS